MKKFYSIGLIIIALIITQQAFPQKENLKSTTDNEQQIELLEGYNFISSRIIAENPDMQDILQNNLANLEFVRNSQGFMLQKIGPIWVNNIGDWVNTEGYLFKMNSADNLIITGDVIDPQTPIILSTGYQMIGYLPDQLLNTEEVFQYVLENLEFVRNTAGFMLQKIGPVWVNNIGDMKPGEGYLVKMNSDDVLIYPSTSFTCGNPFIDLRDGQAYNTVQIGNQCWMAENLNIGTMIIGTEEMTNNGVIEKYCYDDNPANCDEYGGFYQWNEMMQYTAATGLQGICPAGWNIPTDDEWKILEGTVDSQYPVGDPIWNNWGWNGYDVGLNLKSTSGWYNNGNGTDLFGFASLPAGYRECNGSFSDMSNWARFWTSTEHFNISARSRHLLYSNDQIRRYFNDKNYGFSLRCLKDGTTPINQPPEPPSTPNPENGAQNQSIEVDLSWTCTDPEGDPLTYDIYFGTEAIPPQVATGQTETTFDPGTLEYNTEYFWKIVAHDDHENTTEGQVWSFITEESAQWQCGDPFTDTRNEQTYETVLIGSQCWMAENLNIGEMINGSTVMTDNSIIEKYCYDNNTANCDEYGGLYQWNEIMQYSTTQGVQGICPTDWYIPTEDDWTILTDFLGGLSIAGGKMKEAGTAHWNPPNLGANNESGFTGLPGGNRDHYASFVYLGGYGCFWSSYEVSTVHAYIRGLGYDYAYTYRGTYDKSYGLSVRCLKDEAPINQPPEPPSSPNPEDGAENQSIEVDLSWTCTDPEGDPLTYDIYFGTEATPPQLATGQTETTFDPGVLEYYTEYFWKIVAHDNHNNTTEGPVWSFITETESTHQPCPGIPTITYEGQVYNTVLIGDQCWLKENLNVGTMINGTEEMTDNSVIEKYCYDDNPVNCDEYGGLYQWNEIMQYSTMPGVQGICPEGWYIPTDDEWTILIDFLGGENVAGGKMKETGTTHWNSPNTGATNESGFTGFPGGFLGTTGTFYSLGNTGFFWSSTEVIVSSAWIRPLYYSNATASRDYTNKGSGSSVRCIKD